MKNTVGKIATAVTIVFIIVFLALVVMCVASIVGWITMVISGLSMVVELVLLWGLVDALARIERLEKLLSEKEIVTEEELEEIELENTLQKKCPKCGMLMNFDENECPNCHVMYQGEKVDFCKHCGFQLFPEDKICPNCETPRDDLEKQE